MALKSVKNWFKKYWHWVVLVILALAFFIGTSSYIFITQQDDTSANSVQDVVKWASPDEAANYTFSKLFGQTGELTITENYNLYVNDIMHPRSFRSDSGNLKPVSFLGIILIYGSIVKLTSYKVLPFLTPFFAAIGIVYFYLLIKKIFNKKNALLSALLLASFPVYIYYTARSMFHNVLFIVLLIIGLYYAVLMINNNRKEVFKIFKIRSGQWLKIMYSGFAGFFIGLAIITRTSELIWILPFLIIAGLINIRKIGFIKLMVFLLMLFLTFIPIIYYNQVLYSSPVKGGYTSMNESIRNVADAGTDLVKSTFVGELSYHKELLKKIINNIFHFGFHPRQSLRMFYHYFISMFWWIFSLALLGLFMFLQKIYKWKKKHLLYFLSYLTFSLILVIYYGSWEFFDNPDQESFTIGNSYTRYWLPIYLGAFPFASMFIIKFTKAVYDTSSGINGINSNMQTFLKKGVKKNIREAKQMQIGEYMKKRNYLRDFFKKYFKKPSENFLANSSQVFLIALIYIISLYFVMFGSEEGLYYSIQKNYSAKKSFEKVLELTESNSAIVTSYHDKLFFPERKVIVGLFDNNIMNSHYSKLVNYIPLYYYNFTLRDIDIEYLNNRKLAEVGLRIEEVKRITDDFTLYKLYKIEE
ncbi:MAG: glycosyltransferase family 39 protein [Patescibacteria group bacterium]